MKIGHIGSYNRNFGDNVAILNARNEFNKQIKNIEWQSLDIQSNFWNRQNEIGYTIKLINSFNFDAVLVGGGGLIECAGYENNSTKFKLPFNKKILTSLNCPVFFIGLGINVFRGMEKFTDEAKKALSEVIEFSSCFSLRCDGSIDILKNMGLYDKSKVQEIPDPGLIYDFEKDKNYELKELYVQPAFNASPTINNNRFKGTKNLEKFLSFVNNHKLQAISHTPKDFINLKNFKYDRTRVDNLIQFKNTNKFIKEYMLNDFGISMRGHGQMIPMGLNIPGLYFSTQDKVRDFSLQNGFSDYNIDISEKDWYEKLNDKYLKMLNDKEYLNNWYNIRNEKIKGWKLRIKQFVGDCKNAM